MPDLFASAGGIGVGDPSGHFSYRDVTRQMLDWMLCACSLCELNDKRQWYRNSGDETSHSRWLLTHQRMWICYIPRGAC